MDPDEPARKPPSMSEIFDRLCPYYMQYGMSYEDYWHGDPWAMRAYKEAYLLRCRQENMMMWLQGAYFSNALSVTLSNVFAKKGTPPKKYMDKPIDFFPKTEAEQAAEEEQKQRELVNKLSAWKKLFDARQKKKDA